MFPTLPLVTSHVTQVPAQGWNTLVANFPNALDAAGGGTYVLGDPITINGSPTVWTFGLPVVFTHNVSASDITIPSGSTLTVQDGGVVTIEDDGALVTEPNATIVFNGGVTVGGIVTANAGIQSSGTSSFGLVNITNASNTYGLASRSVTRTFAATMVFDTDNTAWTLPFSTMLGGVYRADIDLPHGQVLTSISVAIDPATSDPLPTVKSSIRLTKIALSTGVESNVFAMFEDPETVAATYRAYHHLTKASIAEAISRSAYSYRLYFFSETGTNAASNIVTAVHATFTASTIEPCS